MDIQQFTVEGAALALLQGNEDALDFFFTRFSDPLHLIIQGLIPHEGDAADSLIRVFTRLWADRGTLNGVSIKQWLYSQAKAECFRWLQQRTDSTEWERFARKEAETRYNSLLLRAEVYLRLQTPAHPQKAKLVHLHDRTRSAD